jgi:adenylyltransferase/sulfurtransferase
MARILIPTPLRQFAEKNDAVEFSGLKKQLYNDEGKLRSFVNVYLNDDDIRYINKDATPVADADTLSIVPSIAGGRHSW